jgi:hypothetical protein
MGHVQVIIPHLTENYGATKDSDADTTGADIPVCTLKSFPEESIHCIEWARSKFELAFNQNIEMLKKCISEFSDGKLANVDIRPLSKSVKLMQKWPNHYTDCFRWAKEKWFKYFRGDIKKLMVAYPASKTDENGKLFWTMPKRLPQEQIFRSQQELTARFVVSAALLRCKNFGIDFPGDYKEMREDSV